MNRINVLLITLLACMFAAITAPQSTLAEEQSKIFEIAEQPLADALREFSEQTGLQLAYVATLAEDKMSPGTRGASEPGQALADILEGTGLEFQYVNDKTVAIGPATATDAGGFDSSANEVPSTALLAQTGTSDEAMQGTDEASPVEPEEVAEEPTNVLEEVLVLGTHIRGHKPAAPLMVFDSERG